MSGTPATRSPCEEPIETLAPRLRAGRLSPVTLVEACLERIDREDGRLASVVARAGDSLEAARAAEREIAGGGWRGPLHGIPVAVKDNYQTRDMPTLAGLDDPGAAWPRTDSRAVERLRAAGAIPIVKTRLHQFAWGTVTPPTRNPWNLGRVPGGSSGGTAAAVAGGLCVAGLGSDTGGSIRIPASLCGIVGLKPTFGRVSRAGIVPHSWSLDHAGPMTRSVADAAHMLAALAGPDPADPACADRPVPDYAAALGQPIAGLRLGVCRNHFFGRNQPAVEAAVERAIDALAAAGATVVDVEVPLLAYGLGAIFAIELASSTAWHDVALRAGRTAGYADDVRTLVEIGRFVTAADYLKAEQFRHRLADDFRALFERVDAIAGPTTPLTAWPVDRATLDVGGRPESALAASWRLTYPYNLTGLPAISIPCGFDPDGLPIGLQIAGRPFDEATVLRVAHAYERDHPWSTVAPSATATPPEPSDA
ncbi:amidase [Azospirillum sp. ST 5-10]|uniref:amidase n=1 Tax=unclassified Azospirillum TaxID=2630922 RepID=UPI003F49E079